ncbi:hypothetical protein ACH5RR_032002 [Cinchona calisaya]|uniref:Uncharacterized protein n=1 Tax=Cinchona calisaya TaxID=153742 RepID=A0ABD2YL34_9GENT
MRVEPYYLNRFARHFGFDQGVPDNDLEFFVIQRNSCHNSHLAIAQMRFFYRNFSTVILMTDFIPSMDRMGDRIWWYCRWWNRSSNSYLGFPINKIFWIFSQKVTSSNKLVFVIKKIKEIHAMSFKGAVNLVYCGNITDPESPKSIDASKGINLSNATFFKDGKQVKVKAKRFSSSGSYKKIFMRIRRYKDVSLIVHLQMSIPPLSQTL